MQTGIWNSLKIDLDKKKEERNVVIVNMYDSRTKNARMFIDSIEANSNLNNITLKSKIRNSTVVASATLENKPLYLYNKSHNVSQDMISLVKELEEKNIF